MTRKNRPLAVICAVLLMISQSQTDYVLGVKVSVAAAFCSGTFEFCDDFSTTADPPTNWTEENGTTWATNSTVLTAPTTGSDLAIKRTTNVGGLTQYAIVKFANYVSEMGLELRSDAIDSGKRKYTFYASGSTKIYFSLANAGGFNSYWDYAECQYSSIATADYVMVKVTGTGVGTVAQIWKTTTMPTAAPSGTADCTITIGTGCASNGPGTCVCSHTNCAADGGSVNYADVGLGVGLYVPNTPGSKTYDNFACGGS